jgi:hypothetical protein
MKFIKSINELFDSEPYKLELVEQSNKYWKYTFKTNKYEYIVEFKYGELGWDAQHSTTSGFFSSPHYHLAYDNVLKVTQTVITTLKDFLDKKKPETVVLEYIPTKDDRSKKVVNNKYMDIPYNPMNKRSRLQQSYLKNLDGYKIKYYYRVTGSYLIKTIGLVYRNDIDIAFFDEKMAYYEFNPVENKH